MRAGVCLGEGVGEGVSELTDGGGGLRTRGMGGGESQEEVGDGRLMERVWWWQGSVEGRIRLSSVV